MPEPRASVPDQEFSAALMNETWDMSNAQYRDLLEEMRKKEEVRAAKREEQKRRRGVWQRIKDMLVPA